MRNFTLVCLLAALLGVAMSTNIRTSATQAALDNSDEAFAPYICPDFTLVMPRCSSDVYDACVCYKNGTCVETQTNSCLECLNFDVVSVNEGGRCPAALDGDYNICRAQVGEEATFCTLQATEGCTCYNNLTCIDGWVNACSDCQNDDVKLVIEGAACPANGIQGVSSATADESSEIDLALGGESEAENGENQGYVPYICPDYTLIRVACADYIIDACVCYKNGTCANTQANKCADCIGEDVISVNEGQQCPSDKLDGNYVRCHATAGEPIFCTKEAIQGCTCYKNGTCAEGWVNSCSACQQNDVKVVIEGGSCPANGIN